MEKRIIGILLYFFVIVSVGFSQISKKGTPFINNYTIDDYSPESNRASPQNWAIHQDSAGIIYFGNTDGLLIYDGTQWRLNFLPNLSAVRAISGDSQNGLYVGGRNEFGQFIKNSRGRLEYNSFTSLLPDSLENIRNIWQIYHYNDSVIFQERNKLFIFSDDKLVDIIKTEYQFFWGFEYNAKLFFFEAGRGMTQLKNGKTELVQDGGFYENHTPRAVFRYNEDSLLFASPIDGLAFYDGKEFFHWDIPVSDFIVENQLYSGTQLSENSFALGTQNAGVMIMNKKGEPKQLINKENGLQNNMVFDMKQDQHGDLWLALANGISFLNLNSPFRYYTEKYGIPRQNYYVTKHEDRLYFSNDAGVYSKPWADISSELMINKAELVKGSKGQSWLFKQVGNYLLCGHNRGVLVIKDNEVKEILPVPANVWEIIKDPFKDNLYLACSTEGVYYLRYTDDKVKVRNKLKGYDGDVGYSAFDTSGHLWLSKEINGVFRLKIDENRDTVLKIDHYSSEDGLPSDEGNWVYKYDGEMVITNPDHDGIYKYNFNTDSIEPYEELNEKFQVKGPVTLLRKDPHGNCWIRDDGVVKISMPKDHEKERKLVTKPFLKFERRNLERISFIDSIYTFFGTDEYVLNYCSNSNYELEENYSAHIRKIVSMKDDSVLYYGNLTPDNTALLSGSDNDPVLSFSQNALRFEFSATFFDEPDKIVYKAWLEGYEGKPGSWSHETNKEYTNLHEGDYVFHVQAKNIYNQKSREAVCRFSINPPWYRSIAAYLFYVIALFGIVYFVVRLYVRKLQADKQKLERIVQERTAEINQQKEEIEAQADELSRVNKELQKLSLVASKTDNAVLIADNKGIIEWVNEGFNRVFGYSFSELKGSIGNNIQDIIPEADLNELIKNKLKRESSVIYESSLESKHGNTIHLQTTLTPIRSSSDNIDRFIAISTDISQLKSTEKQLQKLVATKDKFFSIIAHDLKNPFHSIMGISELLKSDQDSYSRDKIKELHKHLYKVAHQGYQLLTNLLEWARAQTGRLDFRYESVKLYDLVEESFELVSSTAQNKRIDMDNLIEEDLLVWADRNTIKTVIRNLISNAVKYTTSNGYVRVYTQQFNDWVEVFVEDNGVGISPENIDKLFRIDTNFTTKGTDEEGGTGLGLILCKEFVEKNGGQLSVDSVLESGSTFSFTIKKA